MKPGVEMSVTRVRRACEEPARRLVSNRGSEGAVIVETVCYHENVNYGFNAMSEKNEDLVTAGVIDPTQVIRSAPFRTAKPDLVGDPNCVETSLDAAASSVPGPPRRAKIGMKTGAGVAMVGRTPWSARVPRTRCRPLNRDPAPSQQADGGVGRGPGGPPHQGVLSRVPAPQKQVQ